MQPNKCAMMKVAPKMLMALNTVRRTMTNRSSIFFSNLKTLAKRKILTIRAILMSFEVLENLISCKKLPKLFETLMSWKHGFGSKSTCTQTDKNFSDA